MLKIPSLALACAALFAVAAYAADAPVSAPSAAKPSMVHGVKLASLCATCAVVSEVKTETRKGKASGVGAVGGAVAGGVIGNQVSDHSKLGTIGGAAVGGLIGNEIEKRTKKHTVWVTHVTTKDGKSKRFEYSADPGLKVGAIVEVTADNQLKKR